MALTGYCGKRGTLADYSNICTASYITQERNLDVTARGCHLCPRLLLLRGNVVKSWQIESRLYFAGPQNFVGFCEFRKKGAVIQTWTDIQQVAWPPGFCSLMTSPRSGVDCAP